MWEPPPSPPCIYRFLVNNGPAAEQKAHTKIYIRMEPLRLCAYGVVSLYIVLRPQGIRKQIKTLRKRHRVHIAWVAWYAERGVMGLLLELRIIHCLCFTWMILLFKRTSCLLKLPNVFTQCRLVYAVYTFSVNVRWWFCGSKTYWYLSW